MIDKIIGMILTLPLIMLICVVGLAYPCQVLVFFIGVVIGGLIDTLFIGGAYYLCDYKNWSLWTIFWAVVFCGMETTGIYKILGIKRIRKEFLR